MLMLSAQFAFAPQVLANHQANCVDSAVVHNFAGMYKAFSLIHGTRGNIEGQVLDLCLTPDNSSANALWVAVAPSPATGFTLMQVGLVKCDLASGTLCDGTMNWFWAWGRDDAVAGCSSFQDKSPTGTFIGNWDGATRTYMVSRTAPNWKVFINGLERGAVSEASICWTPKRVSAFGEAFDRGDPIGGQAGNKHFINAIRYQATHGGNWLNPQYTIGADCTFESGPWKCEVPSGDRVNLWSSR